MRHEKRRTNRWVLSGSLEVCPSPTDRLDGADQISAWVLHYLTVAWWWRPAIRVAVRLPSLCAPSSWPGPGEHSFGLLDLASIWARVERKQPDPLVTLAPSSEVQLTQVSPTSISAPRWISALTSSDASDNRRHPACALPWHLDRNHSVLAAALWRWRRRRFQTSGSKNAARHGAQLILRKKHKVRFLHNTST